MQALAFSLGAAPASKAAVATVRHPTASAVPVSHYKPQHAMRQRCRNACLLSQAEVVVGQPGAGRCCAPPAAVPGTAGATVPSAAAFGASDSSDGGGGSGSSGSIDAQVAYVYRVAGLGLLTLVGTLPDGDEVAGVPTQEKGTDAAGASSAAADAASAMNQSSTVGSGTSSGAGSGDDNGMAVASTAAAAPTERFRAKTGGRRPAKDAALLALHTEFFSRRATLLTRMVKHVARTFPQDLDPGLIRQMKEREESGASESTMVQLCDLEALKTLARRLAPDAAAADAAGWQTAGGAQAADPARHDAATGAAAAADVDAASPTQQPPPPQGPPPPPKLLEELNPVRAEESSDALRDALLDWAARDKVIRKGFLDPGQDGIKKTWRINSILDSGADVQHRVEVSAGGPGVGHLWNQVASKPSREARAALDELMRSYAGGRFNPLAAARDERRIDQEQWNAAFRLLKLPLEAGFSFCLSLDAGLHRNDNKAWTPGTGSAKASTAASPAANPAAALARGDRCAAGASAEFCGTSADLQVLARALLHVLTFQGRGADCWVPRDAALQLRCVAPDKRQHPLHAANRAGSVYQLRWTAADGAQATIDLSGRQLLALADVLDLFMADNPGWLRPGLRAPPPPPPPRRGLLGRAGSIVTAPLRMAAGVAGAHV